MRRIGFMHAAVWLALSASWLESAAMQAVPPLVGPDRLATPTLVHPPTVGFQVGHMKTAFERVALASLRKALGTGEIQHQGDAGESTYWLCYTMRNATPGRVWFMAGELDGPRHIVSHIEIHSLPPRSRAVSGCPSLPASASVSVLPALRLGMTQEDILSALGPPSVRSPDSLEWVYLGKVPIAQRGTVAQFERPTFVRAFIRDGRVQRISAGQSTTN